MVIGSYGRPSSCFHKFVVHFLGVGLLYREHRHRYIGKDVDMDIDSEQVASIKL